MDLSLLRVSLCTAILLLCSLASADEICRRGFYIDEDIDLFGNYTELVTLTMDCSHPGFPSVYVMVQPQLRTQILTKHSLNGKVAFSIRCEMNNTTEYMNKSVGVRKSEPWTSYIPTSTNLPLGQNCSVLSCFWDTYSDDHVTTMQRRYAVEGSSCFTNLNECEMEPGLCEQDCIDTTDSYKCTCWPGFLLENNSRNCTDEDECAAGTNACSHGCINTEGGYLCTCSPGYNLMEDNSTCLDIDECLRGGNPCDHECLNTAGSYRCLCHGGFRLSMDLHSCDDINECDPESGINQQCQQYCTNTNGSYTCSCDSNHTLSSDRHRCLGEGECENPRLCAQVCVNTTGDYFCQCHSGHQLSSDGHNCTAKSSSGDGILVVYMPWAVPLACASLLLLLAFTLYYSITRRKKHGHILETNQDLYEFYLTQEKIDCTYQPVDLSNGLPFDSESLHSDVTSFHSASNTAEDLAKLATSEKTQLVLVTCDPSFGCGDNRATEDGSGRDDEDDAAKENGADTTNDAGEDFGQSLEKISCHDLHDSCVGSSIVGDTSSGIHTSTILCGPDTSSTSFPPSTDTSANSDYIATSCDSSQSPSLPWRPLPPDLAEDPSLVGTKALTLSGSEEAKGITSDGAAKVKQSSDSSLVASDASGTKDRKTLSKTKDYIHATNALFAVIDRNPNNTV